MTDSPWGDTEVSVTLKQHSKFDAPWIVFRGKDSDAVKREVEKASGLGGEGISLMDLVHNAAEHFKKVGQMGTVLGGTVIESSAPAAEPTEKQETPAPAAAPAPSPVQGPTLLERIGDAKTQTDLSDLFLENKAAFGADPSLMTALEAQAAKI